MKSANTVSASSTSPHAAAQRFSFFTGGIFNTTPLKPITLQQIQKLVTSSEYEPRTKALRKLPLRSAERKAQKLLFDYFTPSGEFTTRSTAGFTAGSGMVGLDFDGVPNPKGLGMALRRDKKLGPSIQHSYISQSEHGQKVLVAVDPSVPHAVSYQAIMDYLARHRPHWFKWLDPACKDLARGCLLCHDPNAYLNPDYKTPIPFPVVTDLADQFDESWSGFPKLDSQTNDMARIERWVIAVEEAGTYPGDHKTWVDTAFAFASLGEAGRTFFHRVSQTSAKYKHAENERQFDIALRDARGEVTLGTFVWICQKAGIQLPAVGEPLESADVAEAPQIPAELYHQLPDYLRRCCKPFDDHKKDVMLLSSLGILSGCFPGVGGIYDGDRYSLNLFCFVVAPAASGKGTLSWAQFLARPMHRWLLAENKRATARYAEEIADYRANGRNGAMPDEPPHQLLYLPGDATAAALIGALEDNEGRGIICETEADTLTTAMGGEHGKFADKLCKIFQHEPVSLIRKGNKEHVELERPAVSVLVSGTPAQVPRLMPSAENGLVSRFLFYSFKQPYVWRSVAPKPGPVLEDYFAPLAEELFHMMKATPPLDEVGNFGVTVTLAADDWARLDAAGADGLAEAVAGAGAAGASTAFRLGQVAFRLIGLFTVLRRWEQGEVPTGTIEAEPIDVTTALALMEVFRAHALVVLNSLSRTTKTDKAGMSLYEIRTKFEPIVRKMRAQVPPVPYQTIQELIGVASNTACRWMKE